MGLLEKVVFKILWEKGEKVVEKSKLGRRFVVVYL